MSVKLKRSFSRSLLLSACLSLLIGGMMSCNKKTESSTEETYMPSSTVAVTGFSLKSKSGSSVKLDSVFFSIDLNRGVIFNADSLPVGTDIRKLVPVISYTSSASEVKLTQSGGHYEGVIDYKTNPNDSVDFSGKVVLSITAEDKEHTRSYDIKVNVHKVEPDSLVWDRLATCKMPSRQEYPVDQKTVKYKDKAFSLIKERDGSYTMAEATDLISGVWDSWIPAFDFVPDVRSMCASESALAMLDDSGVLHTSADGRTWENTGLVWTAVIGNYNGVILGMRNDGGTLVHTFWPETSGFKEQPVAKDFPMSGYSDFVQFSNRWTTLPIGFMTGGRLADGSLTDKTWGFDGDSWAVLSQNMMPSLEGASIVPYIVYRKTSSSLVQTEFSVWMLIGGRLEDGSANRRIFVSYDNGVNWYAADKQMQLPDFFPGLSSLDALMVEWPKNAPVNGYWNDVPNPVSVPMERLKYKVEDYEVYWDCPYIYVFGGITDSGLLNSNIWRGVLNRLTFIPQF